VDEARKDLAMVTIDYLINVGLIACIMPRLPSDVQEGFVEKIRSVTAELCREITEIQVFGEAYDDDETPE
jgi:hypothetical protein